MMMMILGILKLIIKAISIILFIILFIITIICLSSVSAQVSFWDGKFDWSIRYFGFKLLPRKKKEKPESKPKTEKKSEKNKKTESETQDTDKKQSPPLMDKLWLKLQKLAKRMDMAGSALNALPPALIAFGKAVTWYAIETDILIAHEDAADCARNYALIQTAVQNLLSQSGNYIHVKQKKINIQYDFIQDKSIYQFRCKVKIHIGKTIGAVIVFLWNYLKDSKKAQTAVVRQKL